MSLSTMERIQVWPGLGHGPLGHSSGHTHTHTHPPATTSVDANGIVVQGEACLVGGA